MARSASTQPHGLSALARLLETETALETELAEARRRAQALIHAAESQARQRAAALEQELGEAAAIAESQRSAACAERLASLSRDNRLALQRLGAIGPERIKELAGWAVNQVLDGRLAEGGP